MVTTPTLPRVLWTTTRHHTSLRIRSAINQHLSSGPQPQTEVGIKHLKESITNSLSAALSFAKRLALTSASSTPGPAIQDTIKNVLEELITPTVFLPPGLWPLADGVPELIPTFVVKEDWQREGLIESIVEKAMEDAMKIGKDRGVSFGPPAGTAASLSSNALPQLHEFQRIIDQLADPTLSQQHSSLIDIRNDLEAASLRWEDNKHNLDAIDKTREALLGSLLPKSVKMVVLYRKMLGLCDELRKGELVKKEKADEEKRFLGEVDRAVEILERLGLGE